jgi:integrase/recombinase XerD
MKRKPKSLATDELFLGPCKDLLIAYVAQKCALGYKFEKGAKVLRRFDRITVELGITEPLLTEYLWQEWKNCSPLEKPVSTYSRMIVLKGFAPFLQRNGSHTHIPLIKRTAKYRSTFIPHIFTKNELKRLVHASDTINVGHTWSNLPVIYPVLLRVLIGCGTRITETLHIRIEDIDFDHDCITLYNAKGGKDRIIGVSDDVLSYIRKLYLQIHQGQGKGYLFTQSDGHLYTADRCYHVFRKLLLLANIPHGGKDKGPRVHDIRHTYATFALRQLVTSGLNLQIALKYLSVYLGHYDTVVTEKYVHFCPDLISQFVSTVNEIAASVLPKEVADELK